MAAVTNEQLENAASDALALEQMVNGAADLPNPGHDAGTVTTRLGRTVRTVANAVSLLNESTVAENAISAADDADRAEAALAALQAAIAAGTISTYVNTAAGIAGTTSGKYFVVPNAAINGYTLYLNNAGSAVAQYSGSLIQTIAETIGAAGTPITGSTTSGFPFTNAFNTAVGADGYLGAVRLYAMATGTIQIQRFTKSGSTFTQVGPTLSLTIASTGVNTFNPTNFEVRAGEYLGFHQAAGIVPYTNGTYSAGRWFGSAVTEAASQYVGTLNTSQRYEIGFDLIEGSDSSRRTQAALLSPLVGFVATGLQQIGVTGTPVTGTALAANTFAFASPATNDGTLTRLLAYALSAGTIYIRRFTLAGGTLTQVGADYPVAVQVGAVDLNTASLGFIPVHVGEYIGFYAGSASLAYIPGGGPGAWWVSSAGNLTSFAFGTVQTNPALQIGFEISLGGKDMLQRQIDAISASATVATDSIEETVLSAALSASGLALTISATLNRNGGFVTFSSAPSVSAPTSGSARYDIVYLNAVTGAMAVAAGTEKATTADPSFGKPVLIDPRYVPLFLVRVFNGAVASLPLWRLKNGIDTRLTALLGAQRSEALRRIPKFMAKMRARQAIKIVGIGDSITQISGGTGVGSSSSANGGFRDRGRQYLSRYGTDANVLTLYTAAQLGRTPDANGTIYTRLGWNWGLVAALEAQGYVLGTDLTYDNWGIDSTSSTSLVSGSVGSFAATAMLTSIAGGGYDLAVIGYGMNERGDAATEDRLTFAANYLKAAGTNVLFVDVPRAGSGAESNRLYTNRAIRRAADFTLSAYVPWWQTDDRYFEGLGVLLADVSEADTFGVHPGYQEHVSYAAELARVVAG